MNIFHRRPLSLILCIMLGGFSLFAFLPEWARPLSALVVIPPAVIISVKKFRRPVAVLASLMLALSVLLSYLYFGLWFRAYERFPGEVKVEAVVTEVLPDDFERVELRLKTRSIDGAPLSQYKLKATIPAEDAAYVTRGAVVSFYCSLESFESTDSFDSVSYNTARGFSARAEGVSELEVTGSTYLIDFGRMREDISRRSILLAGYDAGALFTALLTGDRHYLSGNLTLNFTRTGINHVLALSGAHLVILSVIVTRLLALFKTGKKTRLALTVIAALFYVAMTGFSASVTRAGIMLAVAYGLSILASTQDSVTSLSVSVFVICALEPYAIYDIGLWLSAFATLGVVEAGVILRRKKEDRFTPLVGKEKLVAATLAGGLATLLATGATLLISVFSFSGISPMTIITTPLFSFLSELYIYVGLAMLAIGDLIPIGRLMKPFYDLMYILAEAMSKNDLATFSCEFTAVKIAAAVFSILFVGFIILKLKHRRLATGVISLALAAVFLLAGVMTYSAKNEESIIYTSEGSSESFVIRSGGKTAAVDISEGVSYSHYDTIETTSKLGLISLDYAIFTRYSSNLPERVSGLIYSVYTRTVYIPRPENSDEERIARTVEKLGSESGVAVRYYDERGSIKIGEVTLAQIYRVPYGEGTASTVIELEHQGRRTLYLGSGILDDPKIEDRARELICSADSLILGKCGKKYSTPVTLAKLGESTDTVILSGTRLYFTQKARELCDERGARFYLRPRAVELIE